MGTVIFKELYKKVKFVHTNKWNMHKLDFVLENEIHEILRNLEMQKDHQIPARPDLVLINKKKITCPVVEFAILMETKESEKIDKYLDLARELKRYGTCRWLTII